ncbi:hypothetical protein ASL11_24050 [Paenibacillus sp. Soil750]|nr:hypothetical protein ASL11_24050 [Paenibacillus sp. Soil750]
MLPRHPNYTWEQLALDELSCGLIADGFHLPDQVLKVIMAGKRECEGVPERNGSAKRQAYHDSGCGSADSRCKVFARLIGDEEETADFRAV